ncbi:hypothetical protein NUW54_g1377 [Trametes sanguinea]|uniref:Uncharacterized protein n=1 Tax=Trametes sanguinea TaxID=158606 RepID=A0ACC1Q890_9APHY|nr:hypothetical protein NUW54_g1377 [Trametes sanguinea]
MKARQGFRSLCKHAILDDFQGQGEQCLPTRTGREEPSQVDEGVGKHAGSEGVKEEEQEEDDGQDEENNEREGSVDTSPATPVSSQKHKSTLSQSTSVRKVKMSQGALALQARKQLAIQWAQELDFAADGLVLTSSDALMNHLDRAIVQLAQRVLQEASPELEASLDTNTVLEGITYQDPDSHNRVTLDHWNLAPGSTAYSDEFECAQKDVSELWAEAFQRKLPFFPELMDTHYWQKYVDAGPDPSGKVQPAGPSLQKGKGRRAGPQERTEKKSTKRTRDQDDLFAVSNKGRVNAMRTIKFKKPGGSSAGPASAHRLHCHDLGRQLAWRSAGVAYLITHL